MADAINNSADRALQVLESLFADDFSPKSVQMISAITNIPFTTTWRLLQTLQARGWAIEMPAAGSKGLWRLSDKLVGVAFQYRRHTLGQLQAIEQQYLRVTGEGLR